MLCLEVLTYIEMTWGLTEFVLQDFFVFNGEDFFQLV